MADTKLTNLEALKALATRTKNQVDKANQAIQTIQSAGYQTASDVQQAINAKLGSVYTPAGSKTAKELTAEALETLLVEDNAGKVYNLKEKLTVGEDIVGKFVDTITANTVIPAGTNLVVVFDSDTYKLDLMSGIVDLSGYVQKDGNKVLSDNNFTTADQTKLSGIYEGATKVEKSETNGNIKINGEEQQVYDDTDVAKKEELNDVLKSTDIADTQEVKEALDAIFGEE